jgi:hypothetical protein
MNTLEAYQSALGQTGEDAPDPFDNPCPDCETLKAENERLKAENNRLNEMYSCVTTLLIKGDRANIGIGRLPKTLHKSQEYSVSNLSGGWTVSRHAMLCDAWDAACKLAFGDVSK